MTPTLTPAPAWLSTWMTASAAIFFLLMLTVPSGYSVGGALLLLGGAAAWGMGRRAADSNSSGGAYGQYSEDRILCSLLLVVFLCNALAVLWHGDPGKYVDQGARYALGIPVLLGLRRVQLRMDWLYAGLTLGLLGAAGVAWWQLSYGGAPRAEGFLTSAIPFGNIALLIAFWCLMLAMLAARQERFAWSAFLLCGSIAGGYAFMASATRGGLVAVPILAVLAGCTLYRKGQARALLLAALAAVVIGALILAAASPVRQLVERRYAESISEWQAYTDSGQSANNIGARLEAWRAALGSIPQHPILGWGHADYDAHLQTLVTAGQADPIVAQLSNTHNNFIEVWLHQGILGLAAFLALLIGSFWFFCRRLRAPDLRVRVLACCGASLPAAFAAFGLTQVILGRNNGVMFFVLSLAILWAAMRQAEGDAGSGVDKPT